MSAIVLGLIFLKQIPTSWEILGAAIVVTGLLYYNYHTGLEQRAERAMGNFADRG